MGGKETIKAMILAIPDGNANMRGSVEFFMWNDDMMALVPWLNEWNKTKEGKFNGRWEFRSLPKIHSFDFRLIFHSTGM